MPPQHAKLATDPVKNTSHIKYLPALDGLRGLAVFGVLCFHSGALLPGGYLGVDLFFVLSGFLITSLLIAEQAANGSIQLGAFWMRRARRLFPALLVLLPCVALYAAFCARWTELPNIRRAILATMAYVANWAEISARRSYWDLFAAPSPLEHTWSLAIEEQFYIVWPLFVMGVLSLAKQRAKVLLLACLLLAAASAVAMALIYDIYGSTRAYYGTDTRGAAILLGAALASGLTPLRPFDNRKIQISLDLAATLAAAGIAYAWCTLDGQSPFLYRGGFWLTELGALVLIVCALQPRSWMARALSFRPLRLLGDVSYGVYLWHWPVFVLLTHERTHFASPLALTGLRLLVTFLIAAASYRFIEQPIRRGALAHPGRTLAASVTVVLTITFLATRAQPIGTAAAVSAPAGQAIQAMPPPAELPPQTLRLLLVGDSVANALGHVARQIQSQHQAFVAARGRDDCSILEGVVPTKSLAEKSHAGGNCADAWASDVAELKPDATLVVFGGGFFAPAMINKQWYRPCDDDWSEIYIPTLIQKIQTLRPLGGRIFIARVPEPIGAWAPYTSLARIDCFNAALDKVARVTGVTVIDLQNRLCPQHRCFLESQGVPIRPDGLHFVGVGSHDTAAWLLRSVREAMR